MASAKAIHIGKHTYSLIVTVSLAALAACTSTQGASTSTSSSSSSGASFGMAVTMPGPTGPLETHAITIDAVPTADAAGLYIAYDLGYFTAEGLSVTIVPSGGGELSIKDLQDGKTDLAEGNYVSYVQAEIANQAKLSIIANGSQMQQGNQGLYVLPGSKFKTVADLVKYHARIGLNTLHNVGTLLVGSLLADSGYSVDSVKLVAAQPLPNPFVNLVTMLATNQIDAAWLPEPFGTIAQQNGAVKIADFDDGSLLNFPIGTYIGMSEWVQSHPNTVAAFLLALQEGQAKADTDRGQVEASLVKNTLLPNGFKPAAANQIAALMTLDTYPLTMDIPTMQRVSDSMFEFGLEPGLVQPYNIIGMIQPEPGMVR